MCYSKLVISEKDLLALDVAQTHYLHSLGEKEVFFKQSTKAKWLKEGILSFASLFGCKKNNACIYHVLKA